ncbi:XRE family transcriptional regulator [Burkholderia glumae]|uniref:XRE family transcriptional regulator n=1 Tax=Burkholderia glumae TaxID=337 RepID=UPI00203723A5|nr:helix-turn-helix transcriptional regulator [Burkholderia glumae]MCM2546168.1 helix-turn-helix transcriptional regulator [Burkholderia glumae]
MAFALIPQALDAGKSTCQTYYNRHMRPLAQRLREIREEQDLSQADLADKARVSQSTIANLESGRNKGSKYLLAIARALGVSAEWLESEQGPKEAGAADAQPVPYKLPENKGNVLVWAHPDDLPPDEDRVWMDQYDYRFSAGTGLIQWEIRQKKALPFDIGFFKALGSKPKDCRLVRVHGDSMEPYLFDRDMIMVDTARSHIRDGKVYAIYFEDEPLVKQIFKQAGGTIVLHSINGKYHDKVVTPELMEAVTIMGEVIYRSGSGWAGGN